jgi:Alpha-L-arabinofuranosidase B (ABFB) domain
MTSARKQTCSQPIKSSIRIWRNRFAAISLLGLALSATVAQPASAEQLWSYRSVNVPNRHIRHRDFLGFIENIKRNDLVGRDDATFEIVEGLAGDCMSFKSKNFRDHYLRHQNFRIKLAKLSNDDLFKRDATFCVSLGRFFPGATSFESFNLRGHFIRHSNFRLQIAKDDGSDLFGKDASFFRQVPLSQFPPSE